VRWAWVCVSWSRIRATPISRRCGPTSARSAPDAGRAGARPGATSVQVVSAGRIVVPGDDPQVAGAPLELSLETPVLEAQPPDARAAEGRQAMPHADGHEGHQDAEQLGDHHQPGLEDCTKQHEADAQERELIARHGQAPEARLSTAPGPT